jgi:hypothetical protein
MPQTLTSDKPSLFYCSCTYADAFSIVAIEEKKKKGRGEEKKKKKAGGSVAISGCFYAGYCWYDW